MTEIFLGNPPANIVDWIKKHSQPARHAETWYKYAGDTEWRTVNITGSIYGDSSEMEATTQIPNIFNVVELEIGTGVTNIGDYAFGGQCSRLTSVTIPDSVTGIGWCAFEGCTGLTIVTIPDSVESIGEMAFNLCSRLTSVTFLGRTMEQVQNIEDGNGNKYYPWQIEDTSIIIPGIESKPEPAE